MQVARTIQTHDATTVVQNSPLVYTSGATLAIAVPTDAAEMVIKSSTDLRISEDSAMASYYVHDGGSEKVIPVGDASYLYIKGDSADGTLQFYFHIV